MNDSSSECQLITPDLQHSAARLAAASYFDNPAHIYLCPDEGKRLHQLEWLLGVNLNMQLRYGAKSFCYPKNGQVVAMGFWTRPNDNVISTFKKIQAGLLKVPFKMGWDGLRRVLETSSSIEAHLKKAIGIHQDFLYLNYMVMEESRRGKGWGSQILEHQFEKILKEESCRVLALSTQRFWTVRFYERLGFEVLLEEKIGSGPLAFQNWTMKKQL